MNYHSCRRALLLLFGLSALTADAQRYFVDGFHGGVYGHYPVMTYTQYLCDQLTAHPDWYIGLEIEPETWDTVKVKTPAAYALFRSMTGSRQVEYTNPSYAQSYLYCVSGESIIRQFQMGTAKIREHFPDVRIETYACEEPCFTSCLPTLLPQLGYRYMTLKCPDTCWGGYARNFGGQFISLVGPDGSSIVCVPRYACEGLEPNSVWQTMGWRNNDSYWQACEESGIAAPVAMTYQDAGWTDGPWIGYGARQKGTRYTLWSDYFEQYAPGAEKPAYRMSAEDVCPGLMWGTQVMQQLAQQVRRAENALLSAEKKRAIECLRTPALHRQLCNGEAEMRMNGAWRTLLLAEHHDCWIVPYNRLNQRGTWAENVKLWTASSADMAEGEVERGIVPAGKEKGMLFFNTLPYSRRKVVHLPSGTCEVALPAFGYAFIPDADLQAARQTKTVKVKKNACILENSMYRITLDTRRGGIVSSLIAKEDKREYVDSQSAYAFGELRGYFKDDSAFRSSTEQPVNVSVIEDNTLTKAVRIEGTIAGVPFTKVIRLTDGDPKIEVSLSIDWNVNRQVGDFAFRSEKRRRDEKGPQHVSFYDTRYMLSVLFPTAIGKSTIVKDAPFDVCESRLDNTFYNRWDEIKHNVILNWVDQQGEDGRSLALFSDHTTSYSYGQDFPLALTVQYSGPGLWGRNYEVKEPTRMTYHIMPHQGNWVSAHLTRHSDELNADDGTPVCTTLGSEGADCRSFLSFEGTGYALSSLKPEADGFTLRIFNAEEDSRMQTITLPPSVHRMERIDLQGNILENINLQTDGGSTKATLSMPRFAVCTYRLK